jgi:hypothetical protein
MYCAVEKSNISEATASIYERKSSSSGTEHGEMSECLNSGEGWALPVPFMNCFSGFIVL